MFSPITDYCTLHVKSISFFVIRGILITVFSHFKKLSIPGKVIPKNLILFLHKLFNREI